MAALVICTPRLTTVKTTVTWPHFLLAISEPDPEKPAHLNLTSLTRALTGHKVNIFDVSGFNGSHFVGRHNELDILAREILGDEPRTVTITGSPGTGKTSLALMFARTYREAFPGGTFHLNASPFEAICNMVSLLPEDSVKAPHLLILDDLETRGSEQAKEISEVRRARPLARLLCITQQTFLSTLTDLSLDLRNLRPNELVHLLDRRGIETTALGSGAFELTAGNPLMGQLFADLIKASSPREALRLISDFSQPGLIDTRGRPLTKDSREERQIITDIARVNDGLLEKAYHNPEILYAISPRRFEEFVAEVLDRLGYKVTLTPPSKDGGVDLYAAKRDDLGSFLYVVECKKYAPDNHVGVGLIRQLSGVVQAEKATAGVLATTSYFTSPAQEFQKRLSTQLTLKDYVGVQEWLQKIFRSGDL